ncbi:MAG: hypothetical protein JXA25_17650 [Anaerolineales bacterium]|nr:hypothetical protein [Anaerolineales bacterium]
MKFEDIKAVLERVEIVNAPKASTHNMIVDTDGTTCLVEPGRKNIFTGVDDSDWYVVTNFPLADYEEPVPTVVSGSGSDRYLQVLDIMSVLQGPMNADRGFEILKSVEQYGPEWTTELSMLYDAKKRQLFYCLDQDFENILEYDFSSQDIVQRIHS